MPTSQDDQGLGAKSESDSTPLTDPERSTTPATHPPLRDAMEREVGSDDESLEPKRSEVQDLSPEALADLMEGDCFDEKPPASDLDSSSKYESGGKEKEEEEESDSEDEIQSEADRKSKKKKGAITHSSSSVGWPEMPLIKAGPEDKIKGRSKSTKYEYFLVSEQYLPHRPTAFIVPSINPKIGPNEFLLGPQNDDYEPDPKTETKPKLWKLNQRRLVVLLGRPAKQTAATNGIRVDYKLMTGVEKIWMGIENGLPISVFSGDDESYGNFIVKGKVNQNLSDFYTYLEVPVSQSELLRIGTDLKGLFKALTAVVDDRNRTLQRLWEEKFNKLQLARTAKSLFARVESVSSEDEAVHWVKGWDSANKSYGISMALSLDEYLKVVESFQTWKSGFDNSGSTLPLGYVLWNSTAFKQSQMTESIQTNKPFVFDAALLVKAASASWDGSVLDQKHKATRKVFEKTPLFSDGQYFLGKTGAPFLAKENWKTLQKYREVEEAKAEKAEKAATKAATKAAKATAGGKPRARGKLTVGNKSRKFTPKSATALKSRTPRRTVQQASLENEDSEDEEESHDAPISTATIKSKKVEQNSRPDTLAHLDAAIDGKPGQKRKADEQDEDAEPKSKKMMVDLLSPEEQAQWKKVQEENTQLEKAAVEKQKAKEKRAKERELAKIAVQQAEQDKAESKRLLDQETAKLAAKKRYSDWEERMECWSESALEDKYAYEEDYQ